LTLAGTVAGSAAAVVAYQATASVGTPATTPAADTSTPAPVTTTSWLPCEPGWKLKGDSCVRVKEKVVVVRDLPAPAVAPAQTVAPQSAVAAGSNEGDHQTRTRHADDSAAEDAADDSGTEAEHASDDGPEHEDVGDDD
jgi:hypothetical protein